MDTGELQRSDIYILHQPFAHRAIGRAVAKMLTAAGYNVFLDDKFHAPNLPPSNQLARHRELKRRQIGVVIISNNVLRLDNQGSVRWFQSERQLLCQSADKVVIIELSPDLDRCDSIPDKVTFVAAYNPSDLIDNVKMLIPQLLPPLADGPRQRQRPITPVTDTELVGDYLFESVYNAYWRYESDTLNSQLPTILRQNPDHFGAMVLYCRVLVEQKRLAEALELTYRMEVIEKHDLWVYSHRASVLTHMGRLDEAASLYTQLLQRQPDAGSLLAGRAVVELYRGDAKAALADVDQALACNPHYTYHQLRGLTYLLLNEYQNALREFELVAAQRPAWPRNLAAWAVTLYYLGRIAEATRHWKHLLEHDPLCYHVDYIADQFHWPPLMKEKSLPAIRAFNSAT